MGAVARDFVAGKQDQTAIVDLGVILAFGDNVMIADHEEIVTGIGVFVDDVLNGGLAVASRRMRMEIAAE